MVLAGGSNGSVCNLLGDNPDLLSPEVRLDNFCELVGLARSGRGGVEMVTFKEELARLVSGDRQGLRPNAILNAAEYDDWSSDDEFLTWLWSELYPNEALPSGC